MTVYLQTLGCKLNQSETEALAQAFVGAGFRIALPEDDADIAIINSCTVTARSDAKARHAVRYAAGRLPRALIVLTGCYAEVEAEALRELFTRETGAAVVRQTDKPALLGLPAAAAAEKGFAGFSRAEKMRFFNEYCRRPGTLHPDPFALVSGRFFFHSRAFLKIQDGCDGGCAYCRVPLARGRSQSLEFERAAGKIRQIIEAGFAEIVFTGVNVSVYRHGGRDLADLLAYAAAHSRHVRFRLSSIEPEALNPRLWDALAAPAMCPHFHLPIQSGAAAVLRRMGRAYGPDGLREGVAGLRRRRPDAFIAADVIAGFPGETDGEFLETIHLLEELGLSALHVFPFSPRPGTAAFSLPGKVADELLQERVQTLLELGRKWTHRFLLTLTGKKADVLLERKAAAGVWTGSSEHSVKCRVAGVPQAWERKGRRVLARVIEAGKPCRAEFLEPAAGTPHFIP